MSDRDREEQRAVGVGERRDDVCRDLSETLRREDGGGFGFVCIWRRDRSSGPSDRHGITVEQWLSDPANFGGTWLIDGGWGGPPGPIEVDWNAVERKWVNQGYCGRRRLTPPDSAVPDTESDDDP